MRKSEKDFLRAYDAAAEGIEVEKDERTPFWNPRRIGLAAGAASLLLVGAVVLPLSLSLSGGAPGNSSGSNQEAPGVLVPTTATYLNTETVANRSKVQTVYEKNLSFVSDGLMIKKLDAAGKPSLVAASAESDFAAGTPGSYKVRLLSEAGDEASFDIEVVEEEVTGIRVSLLKEAYYQGERPLPGDFAIAKELDDGSSRAAKESEIGIDLASYDADEPGTYEIGVYLKGNPAFRKDIEVEVRPLEEIDLSGTYAWADDSLDIGSPLLRVFTIDGPAHRLISQYSEIWSTFSFAYVFENGKVTIDGAGVDQDFAYDPASRTILVSGIAGDPDMLCVPMGPKTSYLRAVGELYESSTLFCAEGGYLNEETINYLAYRGGGVYLEPEFLTSVDANTYFPNDATLYLGQPKESQVDIASLVEGQYVVVDEPYPKEMMATFRDGKLYYRSYYDSPQPYIATDRGDYFEIKTYGGDGFRYYVEDERLENYSVEGIHLNTLRKMDRDKEIVVSCRSYGSNYQDFVIEIGTSFPSYRIVSDGYEIEYFDFADNDGLPLYADARFEEGQIGHNYLSDFLGHFGDASDYWVFGSGPSVGKLDDYGYYAGIYEDYALVDAGKFKIAGYDEVSGERILEVAFEERGTTHVRASLGASSTFEMLGKKRSENGKFLSGYPIVGSYFKGSDYTDRLDVTSSAGLVIYCYNPETDYSYQRTSSFRLLSEAEDLSSFDIEYQLWEDDGTGSEACSLKEGRFELMNGRYHLFYEGEEYVWQNVA